MKKTLDYYLSLPYHLEIIPNSEDDSYTAYYPDLPGCITCSGRMEDIIAKAIDAKAAWILAACEENIPIPEPSDDQLSRIMEYSGQLRLRMPKSLHRSLAMHAKQEGVSMNQYCVYLLSKNDAEHAFMKAGS